MSVMRLTSPNALSYIPPRRNAVRVRIKRHGVWHDITHRVHRGVVRHTNDDPVATLDLTLLNGIGFDSLAPRVKTSPLNRFDDRPRWRDIAHLTWSDIAHLQWKDLPLVNRYSPLLDRYNEIMVEAGITTDGSAPTQLVPVFHGLLGDDVRSEDTADAGVVIHVQARDMAKRLQDDTILEPITYRNMYASQIIQAILDERFGPGVIPLRGIGVDDFWVDEVTFEYIDTWQAIQSFCEQSDKDVRYLLDDVSGEMRLTYWTPDTTMTPVWTLTESNIVRESLGTSDAALRHGVVIRYIDEDGQRQQVQVIDPSLKRPNEPLRICLIEEGDTSAIRDHMAAMRMANAVFSALRTEPATTSLQVPFTPYMRIYDVIEVTNPNLRSEPELYAIDELILNFNADEWWTEVVASESVKVRHQIWLSKEAKRGVKSPFEPGDWATEVKPPPPIVTLSTGLDEVAQSTTAYIKATWQRPDWRYIDRYAVRIRRAGSDTYQYQETKELSATFHGLVANVEYTIQVATIDGRGVVGPWSDEKAVVTPRDETVPATPAGLTVRSHIRGVEASITPNAEPDLRHYVWERRVNGGSWEVFARDLATDRVIVAKTDDYVQVRVSAEDWSGNISPPTPVQGAVSGQVGASEISATRVYGFVDDTVTIPAGRSEVFSNAYIPAPGQSLDHVIIGAGVFLYVDGSLFDPTTNPRIRYSVQPSFAGIAVIVWNDDTVSHSVRVVADIAYMLDG